MLQRASVSVLLCIVGSVVAEAIFPNKPVFIELFS